MVYYPNVPNAPGVPPLLRNPNAPQPAPEPLLTNDNVGTLGSTSAPQWGIFTLNGGLAIEPDNMVSLGYQQQWADADYPIEDGGFQSYNQVATPFLAKVRMSKGGSQDDRQRFLDEVAAISGTTTLYNVVTPETVMLSVNVVRYEYERSASNGVGLISVDIYLQQIKEAPNPTFQNTKSPSGASPVQVGPVQPQPPTPRLQNLITKLGVQ